MKIKLNGEEKNVADETTLAEIIAEIAFPKNNFACAVNYKFIPSAQYKNLWLKENDEIDIVSAMQGG